MFNLKYRLHRNLLLVISFAHCALGILNGQLALQGVYSYSVYVDATSKNCTGAIIDDGGFVVTAAACVTDYGGNILDSHIKITAGTVDVKSQLGMNISVNRVYVRREFHERFGSYVANIAVLKLKHKLNLSDPRFKAVTYKVANSPQILKGEVTGFGVYQLTSAPNVIDEDIQGISDGHLRHELVRIYDKNACSYEMLIRDFEGDVNHFCASIMQSADKPRKGVCLEDKGVPLVNSGHLVGIVSLRALYCNELHYPAFYTNVTNYADFIDKAIAHNVQDRDPEILWENISEEDNIEIDLLDNQLYNRCNNVRYSHQPDN